jgi:hypothetical protein
LGRLNILNKPPTSNSWSSSKLRSVMKNISFLSWFQLRWKNLKKQNFWKVKQLHCQQKLTRLGLVECDHENCGMKWIRKSCVFDTFLFGRTWKHEDIRKVEVKIFLWANLEKIVKVEKFRQDDRKRVFKKRKKPSRKI